MCKRELNMSICLVALASRVPPPVWFHLRPPHMSIFPSTTTVSKYSSQCWQIWLWQSPNKCEIFARVSFPLVQLIWSYHTLVQTFDICFHFFHTWIGWGCASPWWATMTIAFHFHHNHHISCGYHPCCCLRSLCRDRRHRVPKIKRFLKELSQKQGHDLSTTSFLQACR